MPPQGFRTAIIFYGLVQRSLKFTQPSLLTHLMDPLQKRGTVDLFLHSWALPQNSDHSVSIKAEDIAHYLPQAQSLIEPQADYDRRQNWEPLLQNKYLGQDPQTHPQARLALMNLCRSLESLQRAWAFFSQHKKGRYDLIIISRADLKFVMPLNLPPIDALPQSSLCLPQFHFVRGGLNDSFVLGSEAQVQIYAQRAAFAQTYLQEHEDSSSEEILKDWLKSHQIPISLFEFYFFKIRANGKLAQRDQRLMVQLLQAHRLPELDIQVQAKPEAGQSEASQNLIQYFRHQAQQPVIPRTQDRFLILTRNAGPAALNLQKILSVLGQTELIVDQAQAQRKGLWYPDQALKGYEKIMGGPQFPDLTAWSRALFHLEQSLHDDESIWLIEEDVAGHPDAFKALVQHGQVHQPDLAALKYISPASHPDWHWWQHSPDLHWFKQPRSTFNPLCRLSARLVRAILKFRAQKQRFTFHELLFASVAFAEEMQILDWAKASDCRRLFGYFRWRPEVQKFHPGISHPVKDPLLHAHICHSTD